MDNDFFEDDIPDLTGKGKPVAAKPFVPRAPLVPGTPPASYVPMEKRFEEPCPKCHGRGRFIIYGRDIGPCFACKSAGKKVYKTPPEARAKARAAAAAKAREKAAEREERAARLRKFYGE